MVYIKFTSDQRVGLCSHFGPLTKDEAESKLQEDGFKATQEWRKGSYDCAVLMSEEELRSEIEKD